MSWSDVIDIKDKMQNDNLIKKLALLYFEGKATDEEEQRVLDFIMESAQNKHTFGDWENDWAKTHTGHKDRKSLGGIERKNETKIN